jgi:lactate permease
MTADAALAAAPIVAILALMLGLGWSAARAGLLALALAAGLALTVFGFGDAAPGLAAATTGVAAEGGFLALTILWILWPALALHEHQQRSGAIDALRAGLGRLSDRRPLQALLVGWFVTLFFEGAAGFGTPVALAAPLLVGLGLPPLQAVVLALLGHAVGVSFGALGTPVVAQAALTGLAAGEIAWRTAALHASLGALMMVFFARALASAGLAPGFGWATAAAVGFLLPCLLLAATLGPELATLGAALLGAVLFAAAMARQRSRDAAAAGGGAAAGGHAGAATVAGGGTVHDTATGRSPTDGGAAGGGTGDGAAAWRALAPYGVLVVLVLATRALPPLADALAAVDWRWTLPGGFQGNLQPLRHPGTLLLLALVIGARLQGVPLAALGPAFVASARRLLPVTVALLAMLMLSRLMLHAGMIGALEQAAVQGLGRAWPLVAPAVGALGSFVTGSATASNVLFTTLQAQTAQALGIAPVAMVAAQGFGAGIGNIVCPHNVVAGAATVGLGGREGEVLRRTAGPCALYLAAGGVLVALLALG